VINVDELLREQLRVDDVAVESVSRKEVEAQVKSLKRRKSVHYQKMGWCLEQVLAGEPFAEEGDRDETIFQLTSILVETWPRADAHGLAGYFTQSIAKMMVAAPKCPTVDEVEKKIRRHQESQLETEAAKENEYTQARALEIRRAFANGRSHPYTEEELNGFASEAGISRDAFNRRWLVQRGRTFYLYFNGSYLPPVTDADVAVAAVRDLAPAHSAGVDLFKVGARGEISLKNSADMMRDYGTVASNIVVDMTAQVAHFDDATRTFIEAPCPLRKLKPTYDPEVDEWMTWMAGPQNYETLVNWIAVVTKLEEACAALYLCGVPGSGKTLFAEGLARLWTEEKPTPLEEAMGPFNQTIMTCPLVLADEMIPRDFRGRARTAELRQFIQARSRPLSRKHIANASLRGAVRLIITANNQDLLTSNESLTTNDIQAIVDRIIYIECPVNSARYLKTVNTRSFVTENRIAKHALWLAENRVVQSGRRFLVEGSDSSLHRTLTTSSGLRSAVCNWLVSYLLSPKNVDSTKKLLVRRHEGMLLVTSRGVSTGWNTYPTNEPSPTAGRVSQALAGLSKAAKVSLRDGEGRRTHYWVIDPQNLITWADRNGFATDEVIVEALQAKESSGAMAVFH